MIMKRDLLSAETIPFIPREKDEETGEIKCFPKKIAYRLQNEIQDAEERAIELLTDLSYFAESDWWFDNDTPEIRVEDYVEFLSKTRDTYFDLKRVMDSLRDEIAQKENYFARMMAEGKGDWIDSKRQAVENPLFSKTLCTIADIKQMLLAFLWYFVGKEGKYSCKYYIYGDMNDQKTNLEYYEYIFNKFDEIRKYIDNRQMEKFKHSEEYREEHGLKDEKINEEVKCYTTRGIVEYFEEKGYMSATEIKEYKCCPYLVGRYGKRLFLRFKDKEEGIFAYSFNYTFDTYGTGDIHDVYEKLTCDEYLPAF